MRMRDIKVGMHVRHARSGKDMGTVDSVGETLISGRYPSDNGPWIATPTELAKAS